MTRTATMPSSRATGLRNLFLILSIEIAFVIGLHAIGSMDRMQIDFGNFTKWLDVTSPEVALTASIRMLALVIAYWILITSAIYLVARTLKIPAMLKVMEITTLPFVRRALDGAIAATILGSSVFGGASAVFAKQDANKVQAGVSTTSTVKDFRHLYNPTASEDVGQVLSIDQVSPSTEGEVPVIVSNPIATTTGGVIAENTTADDYIPVPADDISNPPAAVEVPVEAPSPAETTTTTVPKVIVPNSPTTEVPVVPSTPKTTVPNTTPTPQPVPSPGVVIEGERVQKPNETPQTPVETPVASVAGSYTVVSGDNFWNIAKAQVEQTLGRAPTNSEVANYWVKLIDANKANIRSGDADLIFPGEVFTLPTV